MVINYSLLKIICGDKEHKKISIIIYDSLFITFRYVFQKFITENFIQKMFFLQVPDPHSKLYMSSKLTTLFSDVHRTFLPTFRFLFNLIQIII